MYETEWDGTCDLSHLFLSTQVDPPMECMEAPIYWNLYLHLFYTFCYLVTLFNVLYNGDLLTECNNSWQHRHFRNHASRTVRGVVSSFNLFLNQSNPIVKSLIDPTTNYSVVQDFRCTYNQSGCEKCITRRAHSPDSRELNAGLHAAASYTYT